MKMAGFRSAPDRLPSAGRLGACSAACVWLGWAGLGSVGLWTRCLMLLNLILRGGGMLVVLLLLLVGGSHYRRLRRVWATLLAAGVAMVAARVVIAIITVAFGPPRTTYLPHASAVGLAASPASNPSALYRLLLPGWLHVQGPGGQHDHVWV